MPENQVAAALDLPEPEGLAAYAAVGQRLGEIDQTLLPTLLAVALDARPRPIRTAAVLQSAEVRTPAGDAPHAQIVGEHFGALRDAGLLARHDRELDVDPALTLPIAMAAFARIPDDGKRIAAALLKMTGYAPPEPPGPGRGGRRYRDWNFVYDYEAFPARTRLLLFADRHAAFRVELRDLRQHHEWRVPARKAEALAEATAPFRYFDYDFFGALDPAFRLTAFEYVVAGRAPWGPLTARSVARLLSDPTVAGPAVSAYDESLFGFAAAMAATAFDAGGGSVRPVHARARLVLAAVEEDGQTFETALAELDAPTGGQVGLADILAELRRLAADPDHLYVLVDRLRHWGEGGAFPGALAAARAYAQWRAGNADLCEQALREAFGVRRAAGSAAPGENGSAPAGATAAFSSPDYPAAQPPAAWMVALWVYAWTGLKPHPEAVDRLVAGFSESPGGLASAVAYQPYVRGEVLNALARVLPGDPRARAWSEEAAGLAGRYGLRYQLDTFGVPEPWEYALSVIESVARTEGKRRGGPGADGDGDARDTRLVWVVDFERGEVIAREQRRGKRGWSKGRKVGVVDLVERAGDGGAFDEADERVIAAAQRHGGKPVTLGQRYGADLRLPFGRALYHLEGHPRLFLDDAKRVPLELRRAEPRLNLEEADAQLRLSFVPPGAHRAGYHWEKETPTRYRVYAITPEQARLARAIGRQTLVPARERAAVETRVEELRDHVAVTSATDLDAGDLAEVPGDTRPCAHLLPYGVAYKLELYARPLPGRELYYRVGEGTARTVVSSDQFAATAAPDAVAPDGAAPGEPDEAVLLVRDLAAEERAAEAMIRDCPTLRELGHDNYEWTLDDDYAALRVLLELRSLQQEERISVEHPKGEKLRLVGTAASDAMRLQITKKRDWFEVDGRLTADEGTVVNFRQLLAHLRNGGSEFVELSEGEFVAITAELRARLEAMEALVHARGERYELPPLAVPAFAEVADDLEDVEVDDAWRATLARVREAADFDPTLPPGFDGELRDYQVTGYRWLRRLAEWGVGGCLADDMGLGKTVQALALLVARARRGPALVIAPASVTRNWVAETARFAPGLSPRLLATSGDVGLLGDLDAGDVLVVSYGLLNFVEDELLAAHFATIVLDEAQAIKNPATKRAKLIFQLDGEFRIATTGTPIENHLGELWSLFRFLNPGLLGSRRAFNEKYAGPIRREGDETRADALRKLVRPFVLRRRKEEVLKELPPKTEVNLRVELSDGERALYEALRREAVDAIDDASPNAQRMIVLQQLTRLRQAACHPRLVRPTSKLPSAKLELVAATVEELRAQGHRALIFSQFVRHLRLVEQWVQSAGIAYCYLDGSTPGGKRQREVDRFQRGEADVFLISLKAGGTGLNLTAADYVLHLDPWWNPAAEDQASDRAHRIGQLRPVTVYRFVSAGTIEERILALHAEKRDLADQILRGTDAGGRLSVEEVVDLLRAEV